MDWFIKVVFLIWILSAEPLFADVLDPLYINNCIDFDSQYAFIGTSFGLSIYDKREDRWLDLKLWCSEKKTVEEDYSDYRETMILSVLSDRNWLWVSGGEKQGVYRIELTRGKEEWWRNSGKDVIRRFITSPSKGLMSVFECPLPSNTVVAIRKDVSGSVLFATPFGIAKYSGAGWEVLPGYCPWAGGDKSAKLDACVTSIAVDSNSRLWIGTSDFYYAYYEEGGPKKEDVGGGVIIFDGESWRYFYASNYNLMNEDSVHIRTPLLSNNVTCVEVDGDDIWIGTVFGVSVYNMESNTWRNYDKNSCILLENGISSIAVAPNNIWISSRGGICRFNKRNNTWDIIDTSILPSTGIQSIAYDPYEDNIWVITNLYAYSYEEEKWNVYSARERIAPQNAEELFDVAIFLSHRGIKTEATSVFKEFLQKYPDHEYSVQAKYELLLLEGIDEQNIGEFQKNYPHSPYSVKLYYDLAEDYKAKKQCSEAIKYYEKFLSLGKEREEIFSAKLEQAECYGMLMEYREQAMLLEDLIVNYPEKVKMWHLDSELSSIYKDKMHDYRKAIEYYERILSRMRDQDGDGSSGEILLKIGECFEKMGEYKNAISTYERIKRGWKFEETQNRIRQIMDQK